MTIRPQTDLRYSYSYAKQLFKGTGDFETSWQRIIQEGEVFEELYVETIEHLLELIPKYSGYGWDEYADLSIPIYVADIPNSFAHPLTLKSDPDPIHMLASLLHELVHCNMFFGFKNYADRESAFFAVSKAVAVEFEETFVKAVQSLEGETKSGLSGYVERKWNLKEKPASEYLEEETGG